MKPECQVKCSCIALCFPPTDLAHCHSYLLEMSQLLQSMDVLHRTYSAPAINAIQVSQIPPPFAWWVSSAFLSPPCLSLTAGCCLVRCFGKFKGMEVVTLLCVFPCCCGGLYCLCSLSHFETKGGAFESPKKEKRSHRRWRSRAIGKDAKGTLQVTTASPMGWILLYVPSARS